MSGYIAPITESEYVEDLLAREPEGVDPVKTDLPDRRKSQDKRVEEEKRSFDTSVLHARFTGKGAIVNTLV